MGGAPRRGRTLARSALALVAPLVLAQGTGAPPPLPGHVVDVVAGDYFFRAPDTIPAGLTTFRLRSLHGGHGAWVVRLDPGHGVADLVASARAGVERPRWSHGLGGPAFPPPNGSANATMVLEPGEYAIVCYVSGGPTGKTPPHYQLGMFRRLVVRKSPRTAAGAPPRPDVVVRMVDHAFRLSAPLRSGRRVVRVVNAGTVMHEFRMQRVLPGHTGAESLAWMPESGLPPVDEDFAAVATLPPGGAVTTTLDLPAGVYTLFCVPQLWHGMKRAIGVADDAARSPRELTLSLTDTSVERVVRVIAPDLTLSVERYAGVVRGTNAGWDVVVRDEADTTGENLLYHSREWHGPYPTQVYAWSEATNHFGRGVRTMKARGRPWLVDVECVRCTVTGAVPDSARFTAGTLRVAWRRAGRR